MTTPTGACPPIGCLPSACHQDALDGLPILPNRLQDFLAPAAAKASAELVTAFLRLPEDKRTWSPAVTARSALDQMAECQRRQRYEQTALLALLGWATVRGEARLAGARRIAVAVTAVFTITLWVTIGDTDDGARPRYLTTALLGLAWYGMEQWTRPKRRAHDKHPRDFNLPCAEVEFRSRKDGVRLSGWLIAPRSDKGGAGQTTRASRAVIFCHGHGGTRAPDLIYVPCFF